MHKYFTAKLWWYPILVVLYFGSWAIGRYAEAQKRFFVERDPALSYPYHESTVPSWTLWFFSLLIPGVFVIAIHFALTFTKKIQRYSKKEQDIHLNLLVLGEICLATNFITNSLKVFVGRLRPNYFSLCNYKGYREAVNTGNFTEYLANTVPGKPGDFSFCSEYDPDGHFSFPSGHSSLTFCGMTFMALYLLNITSRISFHSNYIRNVVRFLCGLVPFFVGCLVAASRVKDNKHNVDDTIWGSLIGIFVAFLAFNFTFVHTKKSKKEDKKTNVELSANSSIP